MLVQSGGANYSSTCTHMQNIYGGKVQIMRLVLVLVLGFSQDEGMINIPHSFMKFDCAIFTFLLFFQGKKSL